jgi:hypothetical protein
MVQFRAIDRRRSPTEVTRSFETKAAAFKQRVYEKIASEVVDLSPVDTGTYIMAHSAAAGRDAAFVGDRTSHGKPRGRSKSQFANLARGNLLRSVAAIPPTATDVYFRNSAEHANKVETLGWFNSGSALSGYKEPYHVYARARAKVGTFIAEAAAELGFEVR